MDLNSVTQQLLDVPKGQVATIVTHLEMLEKPALPRIESRLVAERWPNPAVADYCQLFRHDPAVEISIVSDGEEAVGFIELDFREPGQCEIAFFGLIPGCNGKGHGRWMMNQALEQAWRDGIKRVWLHSCTEDSPRALPFYQRCGFRVFRQQLGMMADPRLSGHLPETAAPHVPIFS
jgi:GNAT superfamily N-acetyltransferase